jgi:cation diffusion facilitator CzcD-associated flavoprotein CzcO
VATTDTAPVRDMLGRCKSGTGCDVAIVGAGPYGLSAAAHLAAADGMDIRVFGEPMSFWEGQMPAGMLLRSPWPACHISDPSSEWTLDRFRAEHDVAFGSPVPLDRFIEYGRWFQRRLVPNVDRRAVRLVDTAPGGFSIELEDGEQLDATRVIVAAGIARFAWRPPEFAGLPPDLVSHSVEHRDLATFAGRRVVVIGAGQSALESAAMLHEAGADVEVLARQQAVHWLVRRWQHRLPVVSRALYAWPDVGPAGISHLVARPALYRRLPREKQDRLAVRAIRPAGAAWLVPRLRDVPIRTGLRVTGASRVSGHLRLTLDDGSERTAEHALLATGYRVDVSRYDFLSSAIVAGLRRINGLPELTSGFESTVPGLHFVGAPAAWSHGPLMRFVAGAGYASRSLSRAILSAR